MEEADKKDYELAFLGRTENAAQEVLQALNRVRAELTSEGPVEKITLAYPIKKETSAYFGYFHFSLVPADLAAVRTELSTNQSILRFLVVTPPFVRGKAKVFAAKPKAKTGEATPERKKPGPLPLSNEALEKTIEEILQE